MASIKEKIKKAIPRRLLYYYTLFSAVRLYMYDIKRRVRDKVYNVNTEDKLYRDLTVAYHIVEKGLTMPEPRLGFGKGVVLNLCGMVHRFYKLGFSTHNIAFIQAVSVLREYKEFHKNVSFALEPDVEEALKKVVGQYSGVHGEHQLHLSADAYFADAGAAFDKFCRSRYSVRNYTDKDIPLNVFYECVELAQRSPSFCNRQPSRVHIVKSPEKKQQILALQNGNRGFGHLASTLLVVTSSVSMTNDLHERHENHFNSGMFSMTLLNALHFHKIGACSLNWSVSKERDMSIRKVLQIPDNEVVVLVISCGYVPESFAVASSPRKSYKNITFEHL